MSYNLFLDDFRMPEDAFGYTHNQLYLIGWVIARNYDEFVKTIQERGVPEMVSFDHDLADEHYEIYDHGKELEYNFFTEKTGYHCAQWLIFHCIDNKLEIPKTILIHSMNPGGSKNIESLFKTYFKVYGK